MTLKILTSPSKWLVKWGKTEVETRYLDLNLVYALRIGGGGGGVPLPEGFDLHKEVTLDKYIWESSAQEANGRLTMDKALGEKPGREENISALDTKNTSDHEDS